MALFVTLAICFSLVSKSLQACPESSAGNVLTDVNPAITVVDGTPIVFSVKSAAEASVHFSDALGVVQYILTIMATEAKIQLADDSFKTTGTIPMTDRLDPAMLKSFWVTKTGNIFTFGTGTNAAANQLLSYPFPTPAIAVTKLKIKTTPPATPGEWCFKRDGGLTVWTPWSPCAAPATCTTTRTRTCTMPEPSLGGAACVGVLSETAACTDSGCNPATIGGTAGGAPCVFPFTYNGQTYYTCTTVNNGGVMWCYTRNTSPKLWGNCQKLSDGVTYPSAPAPAIVPVTTKATCTGTAPTAPTTPCAFPFIFGGITYTACTTTSSASNELWCSTTATYSGSWGCC